MLLLDEPSLGLSAAFVTEIFDLVARLGQQGISILLSEQNAQQSPAIADRGYVIEMGSLVMEGAARALMESPEIAA